MAKKPTRKKAARKTPKQAKKTRSAARKARPKAKARRAAPKRPAPPPARAKAGARAGAKAARKAKPSKAAPVPTRRHTLERERRRLDENERVVQGPPSSLNPDRLHPSAARSGRAAMRQAKKERTNTSPQLTGGDVDADWEDAYAIGDEAPGGDNPTPDQDRVDDIGRALGIEYADNEELKGGDKVAERDRHRWELDPASAEDYPDHEED